MITSVLSVLLFSIIICILPHGTSCLSMMRDIPRASFFTFQEEKPLIRFDDQAKLKLVIFADL